MPGLEQESSHYLKQWTDGYEDNWRNIVSFVDNAMC